VVIKGGVGTMGVLQGKQQLVVPTSAVGAVGMTAVEIWERVLEELSLQMTRATYDTWLKDTRAIRLEEDCLVVAVRTGYSKDWLENQLLTLITRATARVVQRRLRVAFEIVAPVGSGAVQRSESVVPPAGSIVDVQLVHTDPSHAGWVMTSNYAWRYWAPLLGLIEPGYGAVPFAVWNTLRSFAWHVGAGKGTWPSINELAWMCCKGDRHRLLGRNPRVGRVSDRGILPLLQEQGVVITHVIDPFDDPRRRLYGFRVLESLPVLTPAQVEMLPRVLRDSHERYLKVLQVDVQQWRKLVSLSLVAQPVT
jgi:hypothetical protein